MPRSGGSGLEPPWTERTAIGADLEENAIGGACRTPEPDEVGDLPGDAETTLEVQTPADCPGRAIRPTLEVQTPADCPVAHVGPSPSRQALRRQVPEQGDPARRSLPRGRHRTLGPHPRRKIPPIVVEAVGPVASTACPGTCVPAGPGGRQAPERPTWATSGHATRPTLRVPNLSSRCGDGRTAAHPGPLTSIGPSPIRTRTARAPEVGSGRAPPRSATLAHVGRNGLAQTFGRHLPEAAVAPRPARLEADRGSAHVGQRTSTRSRVGGAPG